MQQSSDRYNIYFNFICLDFTASQPHFLVITNTLKSISYWSISDYFIFISVKIVAHDQNETPVSLENSVFA
jgi:hypothetical protein